MTYDGADVETAQTRTASPDGVPELMTGFPPAPDAQVTLANWQDPPFNRWAFRHMRELIPSHPIPAGQPAPLPAALPTSGAPLDLGALAVTRLDGSASTVQDVLTDTYTDAFLVVHDGQVATERYYAGMSAGTRHLVMSVSKSILSCVAAVLTDRGLLDLQAPVTAYVPEVADSGYAGARIRDLLDMRTGVAFRETYTALDAEVRVMERSMGWRPAQPGDPAGA
jgi:CubicO group peptidase (beta-lactamase class C family)